MKRWIWLMFALGAPLSSPLACGGDGCLRNSDSPSDQTCRVGKCELKELPGGEGGAGEETAGTGGSASGGISSRAGASGRGGAASAGTGGSESTAGESSTNGGAPVGEGGAAGAAAGGAGPTSDAGASLGGASEPTL